MFHPITYMLIGYFTIQLFVYNVYPAIIGWIFVSKKSIAKITLLVPQCVFLYIFVSLTGIFRADYWISNERKFCDFCKCWIADNKPVSNFLS